MARSLFPSNTCVLCLFVCLFALTALWIALLVSVPSKSRKHIATLLELSRENDVCGLVQEIWPLEHQWHKNDIRPRNGDANPMPTCENHDIWTGDGFQLRLKRLVSRYPYANRTGVVILQPGLGDSSATFVLSGIDHSLAGMLWTAGYEVWLLDVRGRFPYVHRSFTPDGEQFWDWGLDEKVEHDIPQAVEYVLDVSKAEKLDGMIGHSQGALLTVLSIAQSPNRLGKLVRRAFLFAPPLAGWDPKYAFFDETLVFPLLNRILPTRHLGEILFAVRSVLARVCLVIPSICMQVTCFASGCGHQTVLSKERLPEIFSFYPLATSLKNLEHLLNCERHSGLMLNYGKETLIKPDFKSIQVPLHFYFGDSDMLVDKRRYFNGTDAFRTGVIQEYRLLGYGHADFVWGENARELLYKGILRALLIRKRGE